MNITVDEKKAFGHVTGTKEVVEVVEAIDAELTQEQTNIILLNKVEANIARVGLSLEELDGIYKTKPSVELYNSIIVLREAYSELKKVKIQNRNI
jgi:hypothetical protein